MPYRYRDIAVLTRVAVVTVSLFTAIATCAWLMSFYMDAISPQADADWADVADYISDAGAAVMIGTIIVIGCWIYRANSNAHALAAGLRVTPGWAVGWYLVPVANLFLPFRAMKETWQASCHGDGWRGRSVPALLGWWWASWMVFNALCAVSTFLPEGAPQQGWVFLAQALNGIPLCIMLVAIMRRISAAQWWLIHHEIFA
jgi:hypothetical protein